MAIVWQAYGKRMAKNPEKSWLTVRAAELEMVQQGKTLPLKAGRSGAVGPRLCLCADSPEDIWQKKKGLSQFTRGGNCGFAAEIAVQRVGESDRTIGVLAVFQHRD